MARKAAVSEKLTPANLEHVIELLSQEKPITKKAACDILGITYNTTRLATLIEEYSAKKLFEKEQRDKKKYKPASEEEIGFAVSAYLSGTPVSEVAKRLYRSDSFVNSILTKVGCPRRNAAYSYWQPELLPEECVREEFKVGDKVYAARYESLATIRGIIDNGKEKAYLIYLEDEDWHRYAYQPSWELGHLEHLTKHGI